jgi:hypothetical protein
MKWIRAKAKARAISTRAKTCEKGEALIFNGSVKDAAASKDGSTRAFDIACDDAFLIEQTSSKEDTVLCVGFHHHFRNVTLDIPATADAVETGLQPIR